MNYLSDANGIPLAVMLKNDFSDILQCIDPDYQIRHKVNQLRLMDKMKTVLADLASGENDIDTETLIKEMEIFQELNEIKQKYNKVSQIGKLHDMLTKAGIPHKYTDGLMGSGAKQIVYYGHKGEPVIEQKPGCYYGAGYGAICSVVSYGYGSKEGLLEISGLMTPEEHEKTGDSVLGYLSAENVFSRIKKHYESELKTDE